MLINKKNGLEYLRFPNLAKYPELDHGIFTRKGGLSEAPFNGLNVAYSVNDDYEKVTGNRNLILKSFGGEFLICAHQVHGIDVHVITDDYFDRPESAGKKLPECDALITDIPGKYIMIQVADCQPVLLYDPVKKIIAGIHSGWRSSVKNIIGNTVSEMKEKKDSDPADIVAGIGPSLGPCCAEFINYKNEIPEKLWSYKDGQDYFNFWHISHDQLIEAGVLTENIFSSNVCTKCNTESYFSHRGELKTGRFAAVIGLK
ncbi:MAG: peptidoglycan editing factor PgeF [Desulfobacterales bacterium]|nr:peptidoglycan editing factor PgeF [Desulfobacterales bacterium]